MTVKRVTEAVTATATPKGPGRVLLTIITPGQGSSGYYTPEVLERKRQGIYDRDLEPNG